MARRRQSDPCWCDSKLKLKRCHGDRRLLARPPVELGMVGPLRMVPPDIPRPPYIANGGQPKHAGIQRHPIGSEAYERVRHACRVAADVLSEAAAAVDVGVTTDELDAVAHKAYIARSSYPSTLGYRSFPKSICTSVNGVICHGIPDNRPLRNGDIVNIDVTAYVDGMHGDTSATFAVGDVSAPIAALIDTTRDATRRGIETIAPGQPLGVIAEAIEPYAHHHGFGVIQEYGGHGIGAAFHGAPHVNHTVDRGNAMTLEPGMTFTVEPMLTSGGTDFVTRSDQWTEHAADAMPAAQFEHTVIVTDTGVEVLTAP